MFIAGTAILAAGIASATVVYADGSRQSPGSMMGQMQEMMAKPHPATKSQADTLLP
jgi:hypothetical protein